MSSQPQLLKIPLDPGDVVYTPDWVARDMVEFFKPSGRILEPCAGDGVLATHLINSGHSCWRVGDIEPQSVMVRKEDAFGVLETSAHFFITNPPWSRPILHPLITHLSDIAPTWLLFDADWMHTKQSAQFMPRLRKIVSVGRIKWIPDSKMTGKDNCAWYLFDKPSDEPTIFFGR